MRAWDAHSDERELVSAAVAGDGAALGEVCRRLQDPVYGLALRFTSDPEEAADATQDVLVQVITHLASFEGRSKLTTWAYTIASRHLLTLRPGHVESSVAGPEPFAQWLDDNLPGQPYDQAASEAEYRLLCGEVRIACTYGMLLALSRDARIVYLLGDLIGLTDREGSDILDISPEAFRQRLSRARATMRGIIAGRCGLIRSTNPCRCDRQVQPSIDAGILDTYHLPFGTHPGVDGPIEAGTLDAAARELDAVEAIAAVFRTDPAWQTPATVLDRLQRAAPRLMT